MKTCYYYAIIGDPVDHSLSPELYAPMFKAIGVNAEFLRLQIQKSEISHIREIIREYMLSGFAVTMPLKRAIMEQLDELSPQAASAGAVNIVTIQHSSVTGEKKLIGHNTDGDGLIEALAEAGVSVHGKSVIILGNGGAASGAREAIQRNGGDCLTLIRHDGKSLNSVILEHSEAIQGCDVLINATPLGMKGYPEFEHFDFLDLMKPDSAAIDMVYASSSSTYAPSSTYDKAHTRFTAEAEKRGLISFCGDRMLLHQGLIAFKLWTGYDVRKSVLHILR